MASILVSVGTDGVTDWVRLPDGQKFNLGPMSVLSFVTKLAKNATAARATLNGYLKRGEAVLTIDADKMWNLMQPRRAIWASDSLYAPSFVMAESIAQHQSNTTPTRLNEMTTILDDLSQVERKIAHLNKLAAEGKKDPAAIEELVKLAQKIKSPNQSNNSTYYGLGEPKVHEVTDAAPKPHTVSAGMKLSFDVYASNMKCAEDILAKGKETYATITSKVAEGKKFNASKAKADVEAITSKAGEIVAGTELVEGWVGDDLQKLSSEMDRIHGLFHPQA